MPEITAMRQELTVLIPCKDEQHNIRGCIDSVDKLADEILVADSGSTDNTLQIVRGLGKERLIIRVIEREYVNPSSFKNWAIPQATHSWVLALDADERVTPALASEIHKLLDGQPRFDAYRIRRTNYFLGNPVRYSGWQNDAPFRLFRRDECQYDDRQVHEHLVVASQKVGTLGASLLHDTCCSLEEMLEKNIRYGQLAAEDLYQNGRTSGFINLVVRPCLRFLRHYLWKQGFRDGPTGLLLGCLAANSVFTKYAFLWVRQRLEKNPATVPDKKAIDKKEERRSSRNTSDQRAA
jgi:glycosyltransferase involved in cell wall biosynthesis